jgi:hypothetical protein
LVRQAYKTSGPADSLPGFDPDQSCFFIDKPAVLCHTLASGKKTVSPILRQCRIVLMAGPLMLQPAAACCFHHIDILRSVCFAMLKIPIFDGNAPITDSRAAGKRQPP